MISASSLPKPTLQSSREFLPGEDGDDEPRWRDSACAIRSVLPGSEPARTCARPGARLVLALGLTLCVLGLPGVPAAFDIGAECVTEEPPGYRMSDFRAPVPCTLAGAWVVSTEDLQQLIAEQSPVLIDVLPSPRRPEGLSEDALWQPPARSNIPGSVWLPNTGFGELPVEEEAYLRANVERVTQGNPSRRVVFYCLADCWMSWNAARRVLEWGYTSVVWYPAGTDGWETAGLPLAESTPVPREAGQ